MRWRCLGAWVLVGVLASCSGRTQTHGDGAASGGAAGSSGAAAAAGAEALEDPTDYPCVLGDCEVIVERAEPLPSPRCPQREPMATSACMEAGLSCSYGASLSAHCRRYFECTDNGWEVPDNRAPEMCLEQPAGFCPAEPSPGGGCVVGEVDVFVPCEYEAGVGCYCLGNPIRKVAARGVWECYGPPRSGACPELLPNIGNGCEREGQNCHYGVVQQGCYSAYADVSCISGAWQATPPVCSL